MSEKLILIGNGMAGIRTIEEILKKDATRFDITVFGEEPHPNYNRIMLSSVLQGDSTVDDIVLNDYNWYEENQIELLTGDPVIKVDTEKQVVYSQNGVERSYDKLIFATGSNPFMLPLPGADKEGVIAFRNIKDCETMIETSKNYKKAVVIGGGLLGLEAARGLLNLNMHVDVIHIADYLMERQLDDQAGKMLKEELEAQGMTFHLKKNTKEITGKNRVEGIEFTDGTRFDTDLVVMAVGIKPNVALAQESGLTTERAIVVDDFMQTSVQNVYAVGECAQHRGIAYGLVAPLYEQGKVLAAHICSEDKTLEHGYEGSLVYTQLKVSGVNVFSAGQFQDGEQTKAIRVHDEFEGIYKKVVVQDNKVVGAVLFGDTTDSTRLLSMMRKGDDISGMSKVALLPSESGEAPVSPVVAMADDDNICDCNGITKGAICSAITDNGLTSVEQVKQCTTAGRSCGGCKPLIADLLTLATGEELGNTPEPLCGCTTHTHEEVVAEIRELGLTHPREVMNVLGWESDEGCSKCRPAINYYLKMVDPIKNADDPTSRFINERVHANINHNGTFTVVPRMYGGVTNAEQLRKIADVADKYNVPLLKVTGGQRIDLFGVEKEDLPNVWSDLGMRSGSAYAKALRTVKTCVGESFCRFGTQDSIGLGVELEKKFEYINTPHKVKMAVSACPRNCAESGIKDFGVVGVDGGWELYVGGNGGVDLRGGDLFCKVKTKEEIIDTISAFMQYYRENARYLERTSHFVERVGLDHMKQVVLEDVDGRKALIERMDIALSTGKDPWKEIVENEELQREFKQNKAEVLS
ncbi:nitrite reductase large subunit NirB [Halalkalibacter akibai]|uniref:Nitrite reductase n=1 Tax=Halalkalibacter akibai (strain ATCC 43226 / DSM 21942 / CIP 109018 / JCM 9157 / 1139) TaxID=1236973 RepID=W4QZ57_HALA3|nr:nitrite reductase large subunit NirB [Halalkalibacter akibai]GAE37197.1 nitrite reductase [Halalkalibacter akibai JCM 9157]